MRQVLTPYFKGFAGRRPRVRHHGVLELRGGHFTGSLNAAMHIRHTAAGLSKNQGCTHREADTHLLCCRVPFDRFDRRFAHC